MTSHDAPIGYFVHHQGRGHAERAAAIANELAALRPVTLFCARTDIFPPLDNAVSVVRIPSLFELAGSVPEGMSEIETPQTLHCAPLGWPTITSAMAKLANWFDQHRPALFVTDVSAELGQFARICSIPHVAVLQHGVRSDPGHQASYDAAAGLLAPYSRDLEQHDRSAAMLRKTHYAPGVGITIKAARSRDDARRALGLSVDREIVLVVAGGGGRGTPTAPLTLGARAEPETLWLTIGETDSEWHETPPANLEQKGWVDNPTLWMAAADRIVSSCGNTTVHMALATAKPWVVVPEWRYFDEQLCKAEALERAGVAAVARTWPSHRDAWMQLWERAATIDPRRQRRLVADDAASKAATWLDDLATRLWRGSGKPTLEAVA